MTTEQIERTIGASRVRVYSDPGFLTAAANDERTYDRVHDMSGQYRPSSAHVVECTDGGTARNGVILASGGATRVHEHALAAAGDEVFLVAGNRLVALRLPSLDVAWHLQADESTCFGVHFHPGRRCLIVHGELVISRVDLAGKVAWTFFGSDAFTGPCVVGDAIEVTDASAQRYRLSVDTGRALDA